jgi:diguanylate cyclase (GGDEF)-like protein
MHKSSDFDNSTSPSESLVEENYRLKNSLKKLISSANHNQKTQEKFSELELYFLESNSYENLIKRLLIDLKQKLNLTQVELFLLDPHGDIQQLIQEIYGELDYINLIYLDSSQVIKSFYPNRALCVTLSQQENLIEQLFQNQSAQSRSVAMLPLVRDNQIIGSLHLGSRNHSRFQPELATSFLQHLGSIISVCIENSLNQERYKHLSLVDLLTRTKNRRYFFQVLSKEIARSSRSKQSISCLFIDIDYFKQINDKYGHLIGDKTLCQVANAINPLLRQFDVLARFGGEEFTILLPNTKSQQAREIAERIRESVSELHLQDDDGNLFNVTISIGVSSWRPEEGATVNPQEIQEQLVNQADNCVYQAKRDGRNCVRISSI